MTASRVICENDKAHHFVDSVCMILNKGSFSPKLSKLVRADISCHFMKTRSLYRTVYLMNGLYLLYNSAKALTVSNFAMRSHKGLENQ